MQLPDAARKSGVGHQNTQNLPKVHDLMLAGSEAGVAVPSELEKVKSMPEPSQPM